MRDMGAGPCASMHAREACASRHAGLMGLFGGLRRQLMTAAVGGNMAWMGAVVGGVVGGIMPWGRLRQSTG